MRRPADAEAYRLRTLAEAQRDQVRFEADARAYTERAVAQARADANTALAGSLRDGNQELIAANRTIENLPALAKAAAEGLSGSRLTVLNGTDGVNEIASGIVGQGLAILDSLKKGTTTPGSTPPLADGAGQLPQKVTNLKRDGTGPAGSS